MEHLDPKHPMVTKVLHMLDPCTRCGGHESVESLYANAKWLHEELDYPAPKPKEEYKTPCCQGTGRSLHPDRVIGALRRFIMKDGLQIIEHARDLGSIIKVMCPGGMRLFLSWPWEASETDRATTYCQIANALLNDKELQSE